MSASTEEVAIQGLIQETLIPMFLCKWLEMGETEQ